MRYFKVKVKDVFNYEVLVKAKDYIHAKEKALHADDNEWGDSTGQEAYVDEVIELVEGL